MIDRRCMATWS
jgi:hypothetical protein